jgi:hypothetical protein
MTCGLQAVVIDRIAVVVGNTIVKDSDINRDIRVTDFLNDRPLDLGEAARKEAAERLINQALIRREIRIGDYPTASLQQADEQLNRVESTRFKSVSAFDRSLERYGLSELELRTEFQWQLTVLQFIDSRFKPAVLISDQEVNNYYREHEAALRRQFPGKTTEAQLDEDIRNILTGEKVNQLFFAWLDDQRKNTKIQFLEKNL